MVLPNSKLAAWFTALAEAGVEAFRLGTKELAFHPDELLAKTPDGGYTEDSYGFYKWHTATRRAIEAVVSRGWISVENQSPIIRGINSDPDALRILQRTLKRVGVENHYFFCGRDIVAYRAFNVPIEEAWRIVNESQKGLSGVEAHARLAIAHYQGKTEVCAVTDDPVPGLAGAENGVVIFKLLRSVADAPDRGKVCIVGRNPEALWFDDYEDRVLFDEAGLFDDHRVESAESGELATISA